jgi:hypothetical protein
MHHHIEDNYVRVSPEFYWMHLGVLGVLFGTLRIFSSFLVLHKLLRQ